MKVSNSINFNGFAHKVKKIAYNQNSMPNEKEGFTCTALPPCWNRLYSKDSYTAALTDFKSEFRQIIPVIMKVQYAHGLTGRSYSNDDDDELLSIEEWRKYHAMNSSEIIKNSLEKVLKTHKLIEESTDISVDVIGTTHNHYGQGYKINFTNNKNNTSHNLFLKVFFTDYIPNKNHGEITEITRSIYLHNNMAKNKNFPQFYLGDINNNSPYIISEYIEDNAKNNSMQYPHSLLGLWFSDHSKTHNMISDYYIDAGGIKIINMLAYNPIARAIAKKIYRTPDKDKYTLWTNIFEKQSSLKHDRIIGLCYGIKYLPENYRQECIEKIKNSAYYKFENIRQALNESGII